MTPRERLVCTLVGGEPDGVPCFEYGADAGMVHRAFGPRDRLEFNRLVGRVALEVWRKPPLFALSEATGDGGIHLARGG